MNLSLNPQTSPRLPFKILSSTSEDTDHPLFELTKGSKGKGWSSARFCMFPQEIIISFQIPVHITQVNVLINEKKIPSSIDFFTYYHINEFSVPKNKIPHFSEYDKIGFVKPSNNAKSNYKAREFKKIYIDTKSLFFKLQLHQNYQNKFNFFNQVSLCSIEFFGKPLKLKFTKNLSICDRDENIDEELDPESKEKIQKLKQKMKEAIKTEDYDECLVLKNNIHQIRSLARKIFDFEHKKKIMVENEEFDTAKKLKGEVDKLKIQLKFLEKQLQTGISVIKEDIKENEDANVVNKFSNVDMNSNNNLNDKSTMVNTNNEPENNKGIKNLINESISFNQYHDDFSVVLDPLNKKSRDKLSTIRQLNMSKSQKELLDEELITYDEVILPTIFKKINPNQSTVVLEESGIADKGELEPLDPNILKKFNLLVPYIEEDGLRKIFSKQILWKDEGFDILLSKMDTIFSNQKTIESINEYIIVLMKMMIIFLEEKHPSIIVKSLDIFYKLLQCIKSQSTKLNMAYDFNITDRILNKIKQKLGDVSSKIRNKAVNLYFYMLQQDFCDYNNLIIELIEEEIKHYDGGQKRIRVTTKLTLGKLSIFSKVLDTVQSAFQNQITDKKSFPYDLLADYLISYVNHSKSEVRKLTRSCISKFIEQFGYQKLIKKLENVETRELQKLINEIPILEKVFPDLAENKGGNSLNVSSILNQSSVNSQRCIPSKPNKSKLIKSSSTSLLSSSRQIKNKLLLKPINHPSRLIKVNRNVRNKIINMSSSITTNQNTIRKENCMYCQKEIEKRNLLQNHWETECLFFLNCRKCNKNVEVKGYNLHLLFECKYRKEFKQCKRCKEAIENNNYEAHIKENNCNPVKNANVNARCPLCHLDISPHEKGFIQHLIINKCSKHPRNPEK